MPSWSSESSSSRPEQSIPLEATPFILRRPMANPPGRTAPTGARGTRSPTSKFQAPHTTSTVPSPSSTTTRRILSARSIGAISSTRATITSPSPSPTVSMLLDDQAEVVESRGQLGRLPDEGGEVSKP